MGGGNRYHYYERTISSEEELIQFLTKEAESSATMNTAEIELWVVIPSVLIMLSLMLWKMKEFYRWVLIPSIASLLILFAATIITNQIGVKRQLKELPIWQERFRSVQQRHGGLSAYGIKDDDSFENGHWGCIATPGYKFDKPSSGELFGCFPLP